MIDLFGTNEPKVIEKSDPLILLKSLTGNCQRCRLGQLIDKNNNGISYAGPLTARVAVLGDFPEVEGSSGSVRAPIAGRTMEEFHRWCEVAGLDPLQLFVINTVQCKTSKGKTKQGIPVRPAAPDEVDACFPDRALSVLASLPNLQILLTLGMTAASAILGREPMPTTKSHEGQWFGTDYLPGVAVFCLNHPREYDRKTDPRVLGKTLQYLRFLKTEAVSPQTAKILPILEACAKKRSGI